MLVTAERYLPYTAPVVIAGADQRQTLQAKLVPSWASVAILTEPAGADVLVDGSRPGQHTCPALNSGPARTASNCVTQVSRTG